LGALKDPKAVPALEMGIRDPSSTVRAQALSALGQIGGARSISALGDVLLYGSNGRDRVIAARALASQDVDSARQYLDAVADDADQQVREASHARSKGAQGSASSGSALIQSGPQLTQ
jgi:HEAT repeat protein